jgi:conjugal transfer pilus assembly protein TraD
VHRFRTEVPSASQPADIAGYLSSLEADPQWFAKMVVGLTPILMRLTAGDLGPLLSPDHTDLADTRPVCSTRQWIEGRHVVYVGLDALSDTAVAESLAALMLADLAGTAGDLYNHGPADGAAPRRVHVLCDEWGDLVCEPVIQLANKGRGAGVVLYLFGQTVSDLVVKLGDEGRAKRILGNMNNFIVGATSDADTLDFMARKFGETVVRRTTVSQGAGQKTEDTGLEYAATRQTSVTEQALELVPPQVLMSLPDLQYVAIVNRAQVYKGRIPVLTFDPPAKGRV